MPIAKLNECNIYYEIHGEGHPVVLISGYSCDHTFWSPILEKLKNHFQVLIFDNRGSGQTEDQNGPLTIDLMAEDVINLCENLQIKKPHIIGQSMGGTIAQNLGAKFGEKKEKVILINTSPKWPMHTLFSLESHLKMQEDKATIDTLFLSILAWTFGEEFLKNEKTVSEFKHTFFSNPFPPTLHNLIRQFKALKEFNGEKNLHLIKNQTLIIQGTEDILAPLSGAYFMKEKISNSEVIEIKCGHSCIWEIPEELSQILIKFLLK